MKAISLFLLALLVFPASAEIYKWVDAQGNVHYSDEPRGPGAKPMRQLPGLSTYSPPPLPGKPSRAQAKGEPGMGQELAAQASHPGYRELAIVSPEDQGTVRSSPGEVPVFVALSPVLRKGDYLRVILDGKSLSGRYTSTVIRLTDVDRGEHRVAVAVYSQDGKELLRSAAHTFYLHRTMVKKKPPPREPPPVSPYSPKEKPQTFGKAVPQL